jgi:8-oxo-dGTP pyrophosphatase MutT (NUDIX family)
MEILVQVRNKPYDDGKSIELPGGPVDDNEPFLGVLKREVREETGLELIQIEGLDTRIETKGIDTNVECLQPFAAYQTLSGPVDSMGIYFRCRAEGNLLKSGDDTERPHWMPVAEVARLLNNDPEQFSFVDRAGLVYYFKVAANLWFLGHLNPQNPPIGRCQSLGLACIVK